MTFFYCQQTPARRHCINGVNYGPERIEKRQILHKQNKYWILSWTRARAQRHNKKPRTEGRAVLRAALRLGMEMEERGGDWCQVTEERNEETKTSERKGENGRGGKKPFIFSYVFFFALTLKDTSLLMSQKALNNTTDQYISPLMGFSTRAALAQSPEHSQTHEKNDRKPTRARTHQYAIWHMAASSTAQSVKRQMEQWKRHTRGLITTLSSRLPRAQALISITELLTAAPFVLLCVFLSFFFCVSTVSVGLLPRADAAPTGPSVALPQRKQTVVACVLSFKRTDLICQECGEVSPPKCRVNRSNSFAPAATRIYSRFQLKFSGWAEERRKIKIKKKEIPRPERRRNGFIPSVKLSSHLGFLGKRRRRSVDTHLEYKVGECCGCIHGISCLLDNFKKYRKNRNVNNVVITFLAFLEHSEWYWWKVN